MADLVPEWYSKKREMIQDTLDLIQEIYFDHETFSTHGVYSFVVTPYCFSDTESLYTICSICSKNHEKDMTIVRDSANFPYAWVKKHPNRRKYLLCSEDRQGMTIIDLHSWKKHTWVVEDDDFRPKGFYPSKNGKILAVRGSTLGRLDSIRFYDFSTPIHFPWPEIGRFEGMFIHEGNKYYPSYIPDWENDKYIRVVCESEIDDENTLLTEFMLYPDGDYNFDCQEVIKKD